MNPILIVAALKDEIRHLKDKMAIDCTIHFKPAVLYRGQLFNKKIDLLTTGIGTLRMRQGLEQALTQTTPSHILYVGYAGSATPLAGQASLILASILLEEKSDKKFTSTKDLLDQAKKICAAKKFSSQVGGMITVKDVVSSAHAKAALGAGHRVLAIDMEASALAEVATQKKIPFMVVKSILDSVEMELPNLAACIDGAGDVKPGALVEHIFKTPGDIARLPEIQYCAQQARQSLTQFVEAWVQLL
ncbi:MAG: hypothetical protein Q7T03_10700 [Deltaproteobacteria bacterium]|nr:hypothetical protein [Deltaproteobacteria bacterium]